MQKYTIKWIGEKKKIQTKFGEKDKFSIKVEGNENFLGVWASPQNANWQKGDEIEGNITTSAGRDGKVFYNFEMPKKNDVALEKVIALEITVDMLKRRIEKLEFADKKVIGVPNARQVEYPDEPNPDLIPF